METSALISAIAVLFALVMKFRKEQLDECRSSNAACERRAKAQQAQIDALIDGDHSRARKERETDVVTPPPHKRRLGGLLAVLALLGLGGCATTRHDDSATTRTQTVRMVVPLPTVMPDGAWTVAPQAVTAELVERAQTTSDGRSTYAPDPAPLLPVIQAVTGAAAGGLSGGLAGGGLLGGAVTALTAAVGYAMQKRGEVRAKDQELDYHKADAAEGWGHALPPGPAKPGSTEPAA